MDQQPDQQPEGTEHIADEVRQLGRNILSSLRSMWDSEERKQATHEIEKGLNDVAAAFNTLANDIKVSDTGQRLRSEFHDLEQRFREGQVETKLREDFLSALRTINTELEKFSNRNTTASSGSGEPTEPSPAQNPPDSSTG